MAATLCACGCGQPLRPETAPSRIGRFLRGHGRKNGLGYTDVESRLWAKVEKTDHCWNWTGPVEKSGYGRICFHGRRDGVHRISWRLVHGDIPPGQVVRHQCDNKRCVRPDHLLLGSQAENIQDRVERGRTACGSRNAAAKLTESDVAIIRAGRRSGLSRRLLADRFGVSVSTVKQIQNGIIWRHKEVA